MIGKSQIRRGAAYALLATGCGAQQHSGAETVAGVAPQRPPTAAAGPGLANPAAPPVATLSVAKADFGKVGERAVSLYTLKNRHGLTAKVMTYGATLTELDIPDRAGQFSDVVLGFETVDQYLKDSPYFGATIGRVANRIQRARFELGGKTYPLAANNPPHHLHGGKQGWDKVIWDAEVLPGASALALTYTSKSGEEGYPGTVAAKVVYTLTDQNELRIQFEATTDALTPVNMAHHSYWNLAGQASGTILEHELTINADRYTPGDPVPEGAIQVVKGTAFDFTVPKAIGKDLLQAGGHPVGYDLNYAVNGPANQLRVVAKLKDPKSGRVLTLSSDQPGLQFYSGNFLDGSLKGKGATTYAQYSGLCLESQKFPNSINVPPWRDSVLLQPGQTYRHTMVHAFSVE